MKILNLIVCTSLLTLPLAARAAESWVEVTVNAAGDRTLVDQNSIQRNQDEVRYWEYRDMRQSGGRSELNSSQPVYGMMIYRSVACESGESRMQRLVLFNQNREVIRRINYEETGGVVQPTVGDSAEAVIRYVCEQRPALTPTPGTGQGQTPQPTRTGTSG
ncbi:MAG: surface-adhesin E family protein [Elainella sp.]